MQQLRPCTCTWFPHSWTQLERQGMCEAGLAGSQKLESGSTVATGKLSRPQHTIAGCTRFCHSWWGAETVTGCRETCSVATEGPWEAC